MHHMRSSQQLTRNNQCRRGKVGMIIELGQRRSFMELMQAQIHSLHKLPIKDFCEADIVYDIVK